MRRSSPWIAAALFRLAAIASAEDAGQKYYYEDILKPFFVEDAGFGLVSTAREGSQPSAFALKKSSDAFRVFVIGGSIAARYMSQSRERRTIDVALEFALPGRKIEVVNCGMAGYDSYREALILEEALRYSPDAVILMSGHNEGLGGPPQPKWMLKARKLAKRFQPYRAWAERIEFNRGELRASEAFQSNLSDMLRRTRQAQAAAVAAVPPLNYREFCPAESVPWQDAEFLKGWLRALAGDRQATHAAWEPLLAANSPASALAAFFLGRIDLKKDRLNEANGHFIDSAKRDASTKRCGERCQQTIRSVAVAEGAGAADIDAAFRRFSAPALPGLEMFQDSVHWLNPYNGIVSLELLKTLRQDPLLKNLQWDDGAIKDLEKNWVAQLKPVLMDDGELESTLRYAISDMNWRGRTLSWVAVAYLQGVRERKPAWFGSVDPLIWRAERRNDTSAGAWGQGDLEANRTLLIWHLGELSLWRQNPGGAVELYLSVLKEDPKLIYAQLSLAIAYHLMGKKKLREQRLQSASQAGLSAEVGALRSAFNADEQHSPLSR